MSLRLRLSLILGTAFVLIWALAAAWMLRDLRQQMMFSLDQRLVASARMVAGLIDQLPQPLTSQGEGTRLSADQLSVPDGMSCQVTSLRGEILARSHHSADQHLDDGKGGFHDQIIDGAPWRSFTFVHDDIRITTADRHLEREALNRSILLAASAPVLVALLGSLALLWIGIGKGLAPLNWMREALRRRSPDSVEPLQIKAVPSELQPLLDTQNQLFLRIGQTIERERRLTGDAAHELRSPLTAIKTHLQVARMTDGLVREQALAHAEEGADRLHRTLEQLLLLARVEGSLLCDGCQVFGRVARSIIGPGAVVEEGAEVSDSIIMNGTVIGAGAHVERSIIDKRAQVGPGSVVGWGDDHTPNRAMPNQLNTGLTLIGKRAQVPAGMKVGRNVVIRPRVPESAFPSDAVASGETLTV